MTCGIYSITSPSGNCYIGSSVNIERRFKQHKLELRNNRHHGFKLQAAYLKYSDALKYQIVEECQEARLRSVEQEYLDTYKPQYNSTYDAYSPMRDPVVVAKMRTPEARERARQHSFILNRVANLNTPEVEQKRKATRESLQYRAESADRAVKRNAVAAMHTPEARAKMTATRRAQESRAISRNNTRRTMRAVICATTGAKYESSWAAARDSSALQPVINKAAKTGCKAGGHNWYFTAVDIVI